MTGNLGWSSIIMLKAGMLFVALILDLLVIHKAWRYWIEILRMKQSGQKADGKMIAELISSIIIGFGQLLLLLWWAIFLFSQ